MDVDPEVAPVLEELNTCLEALQSKVQSPLMQLDEDTVAGQYSVDEQARISLGSAFTMIMSYYCYKRLRNETIDAQLKFKVDRVGDYVKKLREIVEREKVKSAAAGAGSSTQRNASGIVAGEAGSATAVVANEVEEDFPQLKRARNETVDRAVRDALSVNKHLAGNK